MENVVPCYCGRMKGALAGPQSARKERRHLSEDAKLIVASLLVVAAWSWAAWVMGYCEGKSAELDRAGIELSELAR